MAREMYLAGVSDEELRPDPKPQKPKGVKSRLQNFYYYYKWVILAVCVASLLLAVMIGQAVAHTDPDYTLLLVTEKAYSAETVAYFENALSACGSDLNHDGTVKVQITRCFLDNSADPRLLMANTQMLQARLAARDVLLFAFEPEKYAWLTAINEQTVETATPLFVPLGTDAASGEAVSYWNWEKGAHADALSAELPESLFFAVRALPDDADPSAIARQKEVLALLTAYAAQ